MALRIVEVQASANLGEVADEVLREMGASEIWSERNGPFEHTVKAIVGSERTGPALDQLHARLSPIGSFRILVMSLDAVLPRPTATDAAEARDRPESFAAVSREEVYAAVQEGSRLTATYLLMAALATVVAAIGLARDNTSAVIGAMVVAPLLGPNMGIALGFSLGDRLLLREAFRASVAGITVVFVISVVLGFVLVVDPMVSEIHSRTSVALPDMLLAFAAGAAGTIAYTSGAPTYLVGVMVAVALLPPTVVSGLLVGSQYFREAYGAVLLVATNVAAVTFAAMLTFRLSGMRPRDWWREKKARSSSRIGFVVFAALAVILATLTVLLGTAREGG
jgi:uncharacterized hydrophobic protein (TIGR00341 family)